jgi:integrase/recombinase XerD
MLLARYRHASVRSLERYARHSVGAVARHVAERGGDLLERQQRVVRALAGVASQARGRPTRDDPRRGVRQATPADAGTTWLS